MLIHITLVKYYYVVVKSVKMETELSGNLSYMRKFYNNGKPNNIFLNK